MGDSVEFFSPTGPWPTETSHAEDEIREARGRERVGNDFGVFVLEISQWKILWVGQEIL